MMTESIRPLTAALKVITLLEVGCQALSQCPLQAGVARHQLPLIDTSGERLFIAVYANRAREGVCGQSHSTPLADCSETNPHPAVFSPLRPPPLARSLFPLLCLPTAFVAEDGDPRAALVAGHAGYFPPSAADDRCNGSGGSCRPASGRGRESGI